MHNTNKMPPALLSDFYNLSQTASSSARHKAETIYAAVVDTFFLDYRLPDGVSGMSSADNSQGVVADRQGKTASPVSQIVVYPNPASDIVSFRNLEKGMEVTITDITGRIVEKTTIAHDAFLWKTTKVNSGLYYFRIAQSGEPIFTGRLVVNK